jgi:hypothetical protein
MAIREVTLRSLSRPNIQNRCIQFHSVRLDHLTSTLTKIKLARFKSNLKKKNQIQMIPVTNSYKLVHLALYVHVIQLYKLPQINY